MRTAVTSLVTLCTAALLAGAMPAAAQAPVKKGMVERITVHGASLVGNLEGDTPDRDVFVYLPPGYGSSPARRYPVVYLLHGYGLTGERWMDFARLAEAADKDIAAGSVKDMILVSPDAHTKYDGSMYSSSPVTGDWETFIADDLVKYVDGHYRTIANRASRGLGGHSMGGYGTIRIGMKRPDVFSTLYIMSACCLFNDPQPRATPPPPQQPESGRGGRGANPFPNVQLAEAAAWSPNPNNPPRFVDLPVADGKVDPVIRAKWVANSPLVMVDQYVTNLKKYKAIAGEVGTADTLADSNRQLDAALTRLGVAHTFETYDGDHTNRVPQRIEEKVLPFFSRTLASTSASRPTTSTAVAPKDWPALVLKEQGSFFVGGEQKTVTQPATGPIPASSGEITVNQMYVQYQVPAKGAQHVPVVMVHGCCLSSKTWETTPDGRMGWSEYFVRKDRPVYLADQVSRARSGFDPTVFADVRQGKTAADRMPNILDATYQVAWTVFRFGPKYGETFADGQFPIAAVDELYKQMIPDLNSTLPNPNPTWTQMAALAVKVKGAVLMGHSESGFFPEEAALIDPSGVRGIISIEQPCRSLSAAEIAKLIKIPTLVMFGDHLSDVTGGPANWQQSFASCKTFVDQLNAAGGDATMMHLPELGIRGNSHMLMQDRNSDQLADLVISWIDRHVEAKTRVTRNTAAPS